jgi:hypothetical protein
MSEKNESVSYLCEACGGHLEVLVAHVATMHAAYMIVFHCEMCGHVTSRQEDRFDLPNQQTWQSTGQRASGRNGTSQFTKIINGVPGIR